MEDIEETEESHSRTAGRICGYLTALFVAALILGCLSMISIYCLNELTGSAIPFTFRKVAAGALLLTIITFLRRKEK